MKWFTFYWLDGLTDFGQGETVSDAFTKLGFSKSALNALDFYIEGRNANKYTYINGSWQSNKKLMIM